MPELNKANRQCADVDIRILKTMAPFLFFDTANTTTAGLSGDSVYAMKKGVRAIAFQNPIQGTMSITAQVYPFKLFSLFSDGVIETTAFIAKRETLTCATGGQLTITGAQVGTVFVFPEGEYGNTPIAGTYASNTFTATTASNIVQGSRYEVGYIITKTSGIHKVSFNNKKIPKDYFIQMSTLDKDENDVLTPFIITAYKASVQRNFELSFSSEGEPAEITVTFDLLANKTNDVMDIIEDTSEADDFSVSTTNVTLAKGSTAPDIHIYGASGAVTAVATNAKVTAILSGDYDSVIISAAADATTGASTVTLTDSASNSVVINVNVVGE